MIVGWAQTAWYSCVFERMGVYTMRLQPARLALEFGCRPDSIRLQEHLPQLALVLILRCAEPPKADLLLLHCAQSSISTPDH